MSPSRVGTPKDHNGPSLRDWGRSFLRLRVFIPDRRHHPGVNGQAAWAMRPSHRRILHSYFRAGCGSSGSRHKCEHINHITLNYIGFLRLYIPCAMVLRLMARSPRCPGFLATVAPRETSREKLDPSVGRSGPHAFAVRAGIARPAKPPRPSHPAPTFVTTRTPLWIRAGRREKKPVICPTAQVEFFLTEGWIVPIGLRSLAKLVFTRDGFSGEVCRATR